MFKFLTDIFNGNKENRSLENQISTGALEDRKDISNEVTIQSSVNMPETEYLDDLVNKATIEELKATNISGDLQILAPGEQRQLDASIKELGTKEKTGLFGSQEIKSFYNTNFFSRGRHNGVNFGHEGSLSLGELSIISDFEKLLNNMTSLRVSQLNEMNRQIESVPERFKGLADQLKGKSNIVMLELDELSDQINRCKEKQGWVFDAITKYNLGFAQGKELAINHKFKEV